MFEQSNNHFQYIRVEKGKTNQICLSLEKGNKTDLNVCMLPNFNSSLDKFIR